MSNVMAFGGRVFGKRLNREGGSLMNGVSALIKGTTERSLTLFLPREATTRRGQYTTRKRGSP
jgi:hypothetical protein